MAEGAPVVLEASNDPSRARVYFSAELGAVLRARVGEDLVEPRQSVKRETGGVRGVNKAHHLEVIRNPIAHPSASGGL